MRQNRFLSGCAVMTGLALTHSPDAIAGWTGQMNGTGFGRAAVNVTSAIGVPGSAATGLMPSPSAAMVPKTGYAAGAPLPAGSSPSTSALLKGLPGYIWQASTYATGGDRTDNPTIENLITVVPQPFAFLSMNASVIDDPEGPGKLLDINGTATGGTALLLRGFFWEDEENAPTEEDLENVEFSINELVVGGGVIDPSLEFDGRAVYHRTIPFPDLTEDQLNNFYLITDGFATSAVPEAGSFIGVFALSVAALFGVRRVKSVIA